MEESLKEVKKQIALKEKESIGSARALSDARSKKAASLSKEIKKNVKTLAMPHACIRLAVETPKNVGFDVLNEFGADTIREVERISGWLAVQCLIYLF